MARWDQEMRKTTGSGDSVNLHVGTVSTCRTCRAVHLRRYMCDVDYSCACVFCRACMQLYWSDGSQTSDGLLNAWEQGEFGEAACAVLVPGPQSANVTLQVCMGGKVTSSMEAS